MRSLFKRLGTDCRGATAIEYGLIAAFVALTIVATLPSIKRNLSSIFGNVDRELSEAAKTTK